MFFFRFPKSKLKRKAWAIAVKRNNWEPNDSSVICSEHFKEEDLDKTSECCVRVRENAVPSVFPSSQKHLRKRVKVKLTIYAFSVFKKCDPLYPFPFFAHCLHFEKFECFAIADVTVVVLRTNARALLSQQLLVASITRMFVYLNFF